MTSIFGMALLPLWIMGVPVIGAVISLFMSAPKGNTMPYLRHADGTPASNGHHANTMSPDTVNHGSTVSPAITGTTGASTSYPRTSNV